MSEQRLFSEQDVKVQAIAELLPRLAYMLDQLRSAGLDACGVVLPEEMDPGKYEGDGATDVPAQMMGLPVTWGDVVGLVVRA